MSEPPMTGSPMTEPPITQSPIVAVWPAAVSAPFDDLHDVLAALLPTRDLRRFATLDDLVALLAEQPPAAVVVVLDPASAAAIDVGTVTTLLAALAARPAVSVAIVAGDGYLGTDTETDRPALVAAMAVSGVRSLALARDRPGRSNVVCVPHSSLGGASVLRGPIADTVATIDVANALAFLLDESGRYISGDVVFVDGGRHLFSSHTA